MNHPQPTRREALGLGAAAIVAPFVSGCAAPLQRSGAPRRGGYVDAHSHIWTPDTRRFPLGSWITKDQMKPASFTAEQLMAIAEPAGVDRVVLIGHAPYYGDDNSYLIDCVRRQPGRFAIVAIVEERRSDLRHELRALKAGGVRGIRIGPGRHADRTLVKDPDNWLKAPAMRQLWTLATDEGLILCPLISAKYIPTLEPMLADFPRTTVVLDHFAHAHADKPDEVAALLNLARHPHVHVKVSGFYKFGDRKAPYDDLSPMIEKVVGAYGPDRLMWGSDCPYQLQNGNTYRDAVALVESGLDFLDARARADILRNTADKLFFDGRSDLP